MQLRGDDEATRSEASPSWWTLPSFRSHRGVPYTERRSVAGMGENASDAVAVRKRSIAVCRRVLACSTLDYGDAQVKQRI